MIEEMTGDADDFTAKLAHRTFLRYAHIAHYEMRHAWVGDQAVHARLPETWPPRMGTVKTSFGHDQNIFQAQV